MILADYIVWVKGKATKVSNLEIGESVAVLGEDRNVTISVVRSIIPVYSNIIQVTLNGCPVLNLAKNAVVLSERGYVVPIRGDVLICGSNRHRVAAVKELLTRKAFYDIMISDNLPVIIQDGYCIKVKVKK